MVDNATKCRLVLDSCCDLPRNILDDAGVEFLQFPYVMNDGEHFDDLWASSTPKEFYDRMRGGEISGTAQIPLPTIMESFERYAQEGTPTVYLGFTAGLSGTFETIERVAGDVREKHPDFELYIVDTLLASVAEGLLVYEAIRLWKGGMGAKQLAEWAQEARWFVNCRFTLENLDALRRGGRIPNVAAIAGSKLDVKPMLTFNPDGTLALAGAVRGRKKSLKAMVSHYNELHTGGNGSDGTVIVASADAEKDADWVASHLDRDATALPVLRSSIGPVIGSHVGPGMVACIFWGPDRRERLSIADKIATRIGK